MKELRYEDVPKDWSVCWNDDCPKANECLRRSAARLMPEKVKEHYSVAPGAWARGECELYVTNKPVRVVRGMKRLLDGVQWASAAALRQDLYDVFGNYRRYYRYRDGQYDMGPDMQQQVADVLRKHGYRGTPRFDEETEGFYFPDCKHDVLGSVTKRF